MAKFIIICCFSLVTLNTCKTQKSSVNQENEPITLEGTWQIISVEGIDTLIKNPTLTFDSTLKKINGDAGCNRFNATYVEQDSVLSFGPALTTKMACTHMDMEKRFLKALKKTNYYTADENKLIFLSTAQEKLLILQKIN